MSEPSDATAALRHRQKMEKRKAAQDAEVASKTIAEKGLLMVHTGSEAFRKLTWQCAPFWRAGRFRCPRTWRLLKIGWLRLQRHSAACPRRRPRHCRSIGRRGFASLRGWPRRRAG